MSTDADPAPPIKEQTPPPAQSGTQPKPSPAPHAQTYNQIAAFHIDRLSKINEQVPKLLTYFAAAISQLTNNPVETPAQKDQPDSLDARQQALWMQTFFVGLSIQEIRTELLEQINALERYGVIPATQAKYTAQQVANQAPQYDSEVSVKNGGYGDFDVGVLNARAASGRVGGEHVLDRIKGIVEELKKQHGGERNGHEMAVDG